MVAGSCPASSVDSGIAFSVCTCSGLQSKGLEFDDVFIVNFFSESPAKEEWRVLLEVRRVD